MSIRTPPKWAGLGQFVLAVSFPTVPLLASAGVVVEDKPVSLLSANVVMERGVPCIPLADLARALGGTLRVNLEQRLLVITPGPSGLLKANPARLTGFAQAQRLRRPPGGQERLSEAQAAGQSAAILRIGGADVAFEKFEFILLRPEPLLPLPLLGTLLGGNARLDPKSNSWLLPHGGPNDPLSFR